MDDTITVSPCLTCDYALYRRLRKEAQEYRGRRTVVVVPTSCAGYCGSGAAVKVEYHRHEYVFTRDSAPGTTRLPASLDLLLKQVR